MEKTYMFIDTNLMAVYITAKSEVEAYEKFREMTSEEK